MTTDTRGRRPVATWGALGLFLLVCLGVAGLGGAITSSSVGTWYQEIEKPIFTPPAWVFGPVWTILYVSMAVAAWRVWRKTGLREGRWPLGLFAAQLALNLAWSFIFFGAREPGWALIDLIVLWVLIAMTTSAFWKLDTWAGVLLLPYLVWVSFAGMLNAAIVRLN